MQGRDGLKVCYTGNRQHDPGALKENPMSWLEELKGDPLPWLLEADDPGARYLALRDLLDRAPDDPELAAARKAAHGEGPLAAILKEMNEEGYWVQPGPGYSPKYRSTVWSVILLAQLGGSAAADGRIRRACDYVLDHALLPDGRFTLSGAAPSGNIDCLQGNLCAALVDLGFPVFYVTDLLQIAEALAGLGYGADPRLARTLALIRDKQDDRGRWPLEYHYTGKTWLDFGERKRPSKWVTLRALRVLKAVHAQTA
jgi:hypothetical protein